VPGANQEQEHETSTPEGGEGTSMVAVDGGFKIAATYSF
jgi:hypothetical protein